MNTLRSRLIALLSLGVLAASAFADAGADADADPDADGTVRGIDVSHHSDAVDWQKVQDAGYAFAYLKATEGEDALDGRFAEYWQAAAEVGLARGAYHFYVTEDDPNVQADFFLNTVPADDLGELVPVVDVELIGRNTPDDWPENLRVFVERVEKHFGVRPMLYTGPNFWNAHLKDEDYAEYPLWIAQYEVEAPTVPGTWTEWTLWQYAEDEDVPGVESGADVNVLRAGASLEDLALPQAADESTDSSAPSPNSTL